MSDEGLREIQLNGKQLVFLFMSATVVAVVIFLCGVLVGQGVRTQQTLRAGTVTGSAADPTTQPGTLAAPPTVPSTGSGAGSAPADAGPLDYPRILGEGPDLPVERLSTTQPSSSPVARVEEPAPAIPAQRPEPPAQPRATPARPAASARPSAPSAAPAPAEPTGAGFVVQVAAVREKDEADAMARRLTAKGYPAFVTSPANGPARVFRVRVGKYTDRREAETIAGRLEKEEQFKPWITR